VIASTQRFTGLSSNFYEGLPLIALIIGMFAIAEILMMIKEELSTPYVLEKKNTKTLITKKGFKLVRKNIFKSAAIGSAVGIAPGMGAGPASFITYSEAKRTSKNPENFGKGEPNGIASP